MSIPVSTVPAAIAYLQTAIATQVALDPNPKTIYACVGEPGILDPQSIIEICSEVIRNTEHFAMVGDGGSKALYEKYQVLIKISSVLPGNDQAEIALSVVQRAWQVLAIVETAVRTDPSFGGVLVEGWPGEVNGGEARWSQNGPAGMICELELRVECEGVI